MKQRFRKPDELRAIPFERNRVEVEPLELAQSASLVDELLARLLNPSWLVSLAFHLMLFIALAWWIIPSVKDGAIDLFVEAVPAGELEDIKLDTIEIAIDDISSDDIDDLSQVEFEEEIDDFESADLDDAAESEFDNADIDALTELAADQMRGASGGGPVSAAAKGIQEKVLKAGGKSGEVQFSLVWKTITDLDVHVVTPRGERIFYGQPRSTCFGLLDVDANGDLGNRTDLTKEPVENIRWLKGRPESGRYTVIIHYFQPRGRTSDIKYEFMAKTGENVDVVKKRITLGNRLHVYRYVYFDSTYPQAERELLTKKLVDVQKKEELLAQDMLNDIRPGERREQRSLWRIVTDYPHTDAAIAALKRITAGFKR